MQIMTSPATTPLQTTSGQITDRAPDTALRKVAIKLESQFLSEMLKHAGLGRNVGIGSEESGFSGGEGEEQFGSFLREKQAERMAEAGGIGLAESIFQALKAREK
ncbi:rod-binding protein [Meridianimarinicoccus aquatilis]